MGRLFGRGGYAGQATLTDRLGSVGGPAKYYPYGQERQTTPQDTEKFATYYRDATGLDYAWNRHYTSSWGRFMQADPYVSPDALKNPQGWNSYTYVVGDPVITTIRAGLQPLPPLVPSPTPTCIDRFTAEVWSPLCYTGPDRHNDFFFRSDVGVLALTMYFEWTFAGHASPQEHLDAWIGIGWTFVNRYITKEEGARLRPECVESHSPAGE